jgi:hypothetical protein
MRVTFFAGKKQIPVPRFGGLAPPFCGFKGINNKE